MHPVKSPSMLTELKVKGSTCFLRPDDEKLWESVTGLFFGPNVLVSFVFTGILKHSVEDQRQSSLDGTPPLLSLSSLSRYRGGHPAQQAGQRPGLSSGLQDKPLSGTAGRTSKR